ncbi:hypothetical protein M0Q97_05015 [Candidatus Dojkabacteria bacterium]|jgi:hypothetical protein|nr:hypothetical protein [Candidatus Dojkabacteria bacterium]
MKKEVRQFKVNYLLEWGYGVEISQIRKDLDELEKLGATHVEIEASVYYDSATLEINAISERIETDEEFEQRKKEIEFRQEQIRQNELKQLEQLKSKYGL